MTTFKVKDPNSVRSAQFDWDTNFLTAGVEIIPTPTITVAGADAALTVSNIALTGGNRKVNYLLTGGTLGLQYTVTCRIVTNETPAQTEDRSITVLIQEL